MIKIKEISIYNKYGRFFKKIIIIIIISLFIIINYYRKIIYKNINENKYDLVLPISKRDLNFFLQNRKFYERFLNFSNIVIVSSLEAQQ